ncbi:MAG: trehalose utilization protein ThuA [Butyrivibrio sp.]|nr:trehalose utilization protein ThuA [Butyrivibrio sp.]
MIRITVWNENKHDRELDMVKSIYPEGIHGYLKEFLIREDDFEVRTATFYDPEHGLTEEVLSDTDVLIYWSHALQEEFSDEVAQRIQRHVLSGMGLIALHSAHYSKMLRLLMGSTMTLKWKHDEEERLWCLKPSHPIAEGVSECIAIPIEEMYGEPFDIPSPDDVIFAGWFSNGYVFRSGCTFTRGKGKIFYFQPGHETCPTYHIPEIQKIIINAVRFCAPGNIQRSISDNKEIKD